jgi:hypothetical protein
LAWYIAIRRRYLDLRRCCRTWLGLTPFGSSPPLYQIRPEFDALEPRWLPSISVTASMPQVDPVNQKLVNIGEAQVSLQDGSVRLSQPLDFDLSPGNSVGRSPALVYNSKASGQLPFIQMDIQKSGGDTLSTVNVTANWNTNDYTDESQGGGSATYSFAQSQLPVANSLLLDLPIPTSVFDEELGFDFSWELTGTVVTTSDVTTTFDNTGISPFATNFNASLYDDGINEACYGPAPLTPAPSPYGMFGNGWGINGIDSILYQSEEPQAGVFLDHDW